MEVAPFSVPPSGFCPSPFCFQFQGAGPEISVAQSTGLNTSQRKPAFSGWSGVSNLRETAGNLGQTSDVSTQNQLSSNS